MTEDERFADSTNHRVGMTVHIMMSAVEELCELAAQGTAYDIIQMDLDDLDLCHARLGTLLDLLSKRRAA